MLSGSVNIVRESIVRHTESHMSRLIERAYRNTLPETAGKEAVHIPDGGEYGEHGNAGSAD